MGAPFKTYQRILAGLLAIVLLGLAAAGGVTVYRWSRERWVRAHPKGGRAAALSSERIPVSKLPGPPRQTVSRRFMLGETNSQAMAGMDDPLNERWCDIAGNYYSGTFASAFSYERPCPRNPRVLIRIEPRSDTLRGRLEARWLKPNFAYQIKLRGIFADRRSFEAIGRIGRWRLPGRGTNYSDQDYLDYPDKASVEAYILFDYFVTDRYGNAIREFAADSSLHVLWNASRQGGTPEMGDLYGVAVVADDPAVYTRPKREARAEWLWAEREHGRYQRRDELIRLPPGDYMAELVLTEESFHSSESDGGYWATVYRCPISFTIGP